MRTSVAPGDDNDPDIFEVLVTAAQAWPAFERAVLSAKTHVLASFRIFDFSTRLLSPEACEIGETWSDLVEHVVARGVDFHLTISDFDPVMGQELHQKTNRSVAQAEEIAIRLQRRETDITVGKLTVEGALHPARAGLLPRLVFGPFLRKKQNEIATSRYKAAREKTGEALLPEVRPVTHHQKVAVIDDRLLYVGGLDLNNRRCDTMEHAVSSPQTWADVQLLVSGPEAKEAAHYLRNFQRYVAGKAPPPEGKRIRRTLSAPRRFGFWALSPRTVLREIEEDYLAAFERAERLIYLETQFLRSSVLAEGLAAAAKRNPDLGLVLVLPALPDDVAFEGNRDLDARYGMALQARALETVQGAFGSRAVIASPVQPIMADRESPSVLAGSPVIYVHSKVLITDDTFAMVGSANMNGRSMRWDTEVALRVTERARVRKVWQAMCGHWWDAQHLPNEGRQLATASGWWSDEIARNGLRLPEKRTGFLVPHDPTKMDDLHQSLPGATEDVV
ncbi:phospholipase D family protein [Phaeobacter porticola]|uniref:Phospholipase D n=1 Tax=Phaeobacter porticola TaxID=1844006 RepID=A0A1L3I7A1_9RHOB|nr:phospholipase D-like domain-containing protein [Phaeobacter porticola]APG48028.1 Phosphatidylserine/phosphatidylglycerophosphate/ cardiolipin synthase [Phaeobacter porticola]